MPRSVRTKIVSPRRQEQKEVSEDSQFDQLSLELLDHISYYLTDFTDLLSFSSVNVATHQLRHIRHSHVYKAMQQVIYRLHLVPTCHCEPLIVQSVKSIRREISYFFFIDPLRHGRFHLVRDNINYDLQLTTRGIMGCAIGQSISCENCGAMQSHNTDLNIKSYNSVWNDNTRNFEHYRKLTWDLHNYDLGTLPQKTQCVDVRRHYKTKDNLDRRVHYNLTSEFKYNKIFLLAEGVDIGDLWRLLALIETTRASREEIYYQCNKTERETYEKMIAVKINKKKATYRRKLHRAVISRAICPLPREGYEPATPLLTSEEIQKLAEILYHQPQQLQQFLHDTTTIPLPIDQLVIKGSYVPKTYRRSENDILPFD